MGKGQRGQRGRRGRASGSARPRSGLAGYRRSERRVRVALAACRSLPSYPGPANKPLLGTQAASGGGLAASVKGLTPRLIPASRGVRVTPRCLLLPPSITRFDNALPTPRSRLGLRGRSSLPGLLGLESGLLAGAPGDAACVCRGGGGAEEGGGISRLGLQAEFLEILSVFKKKKKIKILCPSVSRLRFASAGAELMENRSVAPALGARISRFKN